MPEYRNFIDADSIASDLSSSLEHFLLMVILGINL